MMKGSENPVTQLLKRPDWTLRRELELLINKQMRDRWAPRSKRLSRCAEKDSLKIPFTVKAAPWQTEVTLF